MERYTEHMTGETFDVIVIGGGITGAAIAYEASSRGLLTALFEKGDFSEATSAASSKLIHGGLRYLNNREYRLVRESLMERRTLSNIAPNFVYPFPMLFPHYQSSLKSNKWLTRIGLVLYDRLATGRSNTWDPSKKIPSHKAISPKEATRLQPIIKGEGLTGASLFYDCLSICPERLALAFIKSALHWGARAANYARVTEFLLKGQGVCGVRVRDLLTEKEWDVNARITINCSGPWADHVLALLPTGANAPHLQRSEGIHIITRRLTNDNAIVGAITPGGRHCFMIPWRGHTLIGTTDKPYHGHPDDYRVTQSSIEELIREVNGAFDGLNLTIGDVLYSYGGLRPLVESRRKETYRSSRRYEIHDHTLDGITGLLTVEGGKWTTSRRLAEKTVDRLAQTAGFSISPSLSNSRYLKGCEIKDLNEFLSRVKEENRDFNETTLDCLGRLYGTEYKNVLALAREENSLLQPLNTDGEILAQALHGVRHEMGRTLKDIVLRRTGIATLGNPGKEILSRVARAVASELKWDEQKISEEVEKTIDFLKLPLEATPSHERQTQNVR